MPNFEYCLQDPVTDNLRCLKNTIETIENYNFQSFPHITAFKKCSMLCLKKLGLFDKNTSLTENTMAIIELDSCFITHILHTDSESSPVNWNLLKIFNITIGFIIIYAVFNIVKNNSLLIITLRSKIRHYLNKCYIFFVEPKETNAPKIDMVTILGMINSLTEAIEKTNKSQEDIFTGITYLQQKLDYISKEIRLLKAIYLKFTAVHKMTKKNNGSLAYKSKRNNIEFLTVNKEKQNEKRSIENNKNKATANSSVVSQDSIVVEQKGKITRQKTPSSNINAQKRPLLDISPNSLNIQTQNTVRPPSTGNPPIEKRSGYVETLSHGNDLLRLGFETKPKEVPLFKAGNPSIRIHGRKTGMIFDLTSKEGRRIWKDYIGSNKSTRTNQEQQQQQQANSNIQNENLTSASEPLSNFPTDIRTEDKDGNPYRRVYVPGRGWYSRMRYLEVVSSNA
ncbi:uncharacterized protein SCDLUD_005226 [Saccharomycodes ludwigii]|uniref:uncharacterized protein n=1 Tax=Saccharomycodes ludwigii TaxID=36035 RepID=UPI001E880A99|nr:hypothetical protein SCDLUD_005226 [Saccharomycodes ludwigii]KAH3898885.1 hypothetical protein SCDLUD_005226 [Saccharomycodes ludwigii]